MTAAADVYRVKVSREIPGANVRHDKDHQAIVDLQCSACGKWKRSVYSTFRRMPPDVILNHLKRKGWHIGKKSNQHVCPDHPKEKPVPEAKTQSIVEVNTPTSPVLSDLARKAKRDAIAWLDEAFNVEAGSYRSGVDDKTISAEVGLSVAAVADLREQFYGPIKVPKELQDFAARLDAVELTANYLKAEAQSMIDAVDKLLKEINEDRGSLGKLVTNNGWRA